MAQDATMSYWLQWYRGVGSGGRKRRTCGQFGCDLPFRYVQVKSVG